jgi:hypothetical protein
MIFLAVALIIALLLGGYLSGPLKDPDLWWHIVIGRWIVSNGRVPDRDLWNDFSDPDKHWRAYSWLAEVNYAWFEQIGGLDGLLWLKLLWAMLFCFVVAYGLIRLSGSSLVGGCIAVITLGSFVTSFALRPQIVSWGLFSLLIVVAELRRQRAMQLKPAVALLILSGSLWANTNITSAMGLAFLILWAFSDEEPAAKNSSPRFNKLTLPGAYLAGTFITPYLGGEWLTFATKSSHPLMFKTILEFQPANFTHLMPGVGLCLITAFYLILFQTRPQIPRVLPLTAGLVFIGAMTVRKFLPFSILLTAVLIAGLWRLLDKDQRETCSLTNGFVLLDEKIQRLSRKSLSLIAIVVLSIAALNTASALRSPISLAHVPRLALDFTVDQNLPRPIVHNFRTGGYVMYHFSDAQGEPAFKVAIDGRTNVNDPEIYELHHKSYFAQRDWQEFFLKTRAETIVWRNSSSLVTVLLENHDWCEVYTDATEENEKTGVSVFVKRGYYDQWKSKLNSRDC